MRHTVAPDELANPAAQPGEVTTMVLAGHTQSVRVMAAVGDEVEVETDLNAEPGER